MNKDVLWAAMKQFLLPCAIAALVTLFQFLDLFPTSGNIVKGLTIFFTTLFFCISAKAIA